MNITLKSVGMALACAFAAGQVHANGTAPTVVAGQASFVTRGSSLNITNSPGTIINWQGFSIGAGETTRFIQQNSASSVLNRVTGSDPSSILGMFTSNGRVFLINPNGILVGLGARIDMVELVASALNMNNQDFRAGRLNFTPNSLAGKVENQGSITTPSGGKVYLVGATVINSGIINSPKGEVILAAGKSVRIFDSSTPGVRVEITAGNNTTVNLGEILAQSGEVGIYGAALQNSGIINADQVGLDVTGKIVLRASQDVTLGANSQLSASGGQGGMITIQSDTGTTLVSGTIDASSSGVGNTGGTVQALGNKVGLVGGHINASGKEGGGTVLIGGDLHGANFAVQNSSATYMSGDSSITADAITRGNGGKVVLWSNDSTRAYGSITARGGAQSGDGGMIETSGHWLDVAGISVNASAPSGKSGTWLLDPADVTIGAGAGNGTFSVGDPQVFSPDTGVSTALVDAGALQATLNGGTNVTINTTNNGTPGIAPLGGDITVASALTWTTAKTLTLNATNDVIVNFAMTATASTPGGSGIVLNAGHDVLINAAMTASSDNSAIRLTAGHDVIAGFAITASAINTVINISAGNNVTSTSAVTATGSGDKIDMIAGGNGSVTVNTVTASGGGAVNLRANKDVIVNGAITADTGLNAVILLADNDGTGPGLAGGTVTFGALGNVSTPSTIIRFNPNGYVNTATEIAAYVTKLGATTAVDAKAWVFAQGTDKVYDGLTTATVNSLKASPIGESLTTTTAIFDTQNAGANKPITFAGAVLTGSTDYALFAPFGAPVGTGTATASITPASLSVTASSAGKPYDGLAYSGGNGVAYSGFVNGETSTALGGTLAYSGTSQGAINAGAYVITAGGLSSGNYLISYTDGGLTVNPVLLSVTANAAGKSYDGLAFSGGNGVSYSGFVHGETAAVLGGALAYSGSSQGAINAGSYFITPGGLSSGNYLFSYADGGLTVNPVLLSVTANAVGKTYDGLAFSGGNGVSYSGFVHGETAAVLGGAVVYSGASQGAINAGGYVITPGGQSSGNYIISYVNSALTVNTAPLTVTASDVTKTYGQTPALSAFTSSPLQNGESIGSVTEFSTGAVGTASVVGGPYAITPSAATGGTFTPSNYTISYVNGALTVSTALLTVTASDVTKTYGQTPALSAFTYTGQQNGDTVGSVTETSPGTVGTASVVGGPYAITPSAATGGTFTPSNYTLTYVDGALTVTPASLTVTASNAAKTYGQSPVLSAFTYTGQQNGDTVGSVTETSPGTLSTATVAGSTYVITPSLATGGTFDPANYTLGYVNGALTVTPASLTVTAVNATKTYGQTPVLSAFTYTGQQNGDTVGSVTETSLGTVGTTSVVGGPYAITPSAATGGTFTPSNYTLTYVDGALTVTPASLTVTASNATKTYGQTPALSAFTYTGQQNGDTVGSVTETSLGTVGTASVVGGPYAITPSAATGGTFTPSNYTISYVNGALTVNTVPLTVTASNAAKTYGQSPVLSAFTYTGQQNGETVGSVTEFSTGAVGTASVVGGPYAITPSAASGGTFTPSNYTISYVNGALTVTPAALTVTANAAGKTYNGLAYSGGNGVSYNGFVNGEGAGVLSGALVYSGNSQGAVNAGGYLITPSGLTSANYIISDFNGVLTVGKVALSVTANSAAKPYNGLAYSGGNGVSYSGFVNGEGSGILGGTLAYSGNSQGAVNAGGYLITPSGLTSANYNISDFSGVLTVGKVALSVTANSAIKTYDGLAYSAGNGVIYSGFVNGEGTGALGGALAYSGTSQNVVNAGSYTITPGGWTSTNYNISNFNGALTVNPAPLSVIANAFVKTYDGLAYSVGNGVIYSGFVNGETSTVLGGTLAYSGTSQGAINVGGYVITPGGLTSSNYNISNFDGALTVNPALLSVVASAASRMFGAANPMFTFTLSGFVNGETAASAGVTGTAALDSIATRTTPAGPSAITAGAGSLAAGNYVFTHLVNGTLTINPVAQAVTPPTYLVNGTPIVSSMPVPDYNGNSHCVIDADNYIFKTKTVARENICSPVRTIRLIEVNKKEDASPATNVFLADNSSTEILHDSGSVNFPDKTIAIDKTIDTGENAKPAGNRDCGKAPVHTSIHAKPHHPKVIYQQAVVRNPFSHTRPSIKRKASKRLTCIDGIYVETQ